MYKMHIRFVFGIFGNFCTSLRARRMCKSSRMNQVLCNVSLTFITRLFRNHTCAGSQQAPCYDTTLVHIFKSMPHISRSQVTYTMSKVRHIKKSCHIYQGVMSHTQVCKAWVGFAFSDAYSSTSDDEALEFMKCHWLISRTGKRQERWFDKLKNMGRTISVVEMKTD